MIVVQNGKNERVRSSRQGGETDPVKEEECTDFERGADDARDDCEGLSGGNQAGMDRREKAKRTRLTTNLAVPKRRSRVIDVL